MRKIAVIDLGSNSVRMSIFGCEESKSPTVLANYRQTIRLSQGMTTDMRLQAEPQVRAATALAEYRKILDAQGITELYAVATAAVRKAENREEFLKLVRDVSGIEIRVIDGETEAALDALAVKRLLGADRGIICDIGGGSTELIGVDTSQEQNFAVSIPFGSRGICEMFFENGETADAVKAAEDFVNSEFAKLSRLCDFKNTTVVGIGGTLRATAKYRLGDTSAAAIAKCEIQTPCMRELIDAVMQASFDERKNMPGIGEERADIISGGLVFIKCLADKISPDRFVIADIGVREGVLFDVLENGGIL